MRSYFGHAVTILANGEHLPHVDNCVDLDPLVTDFYGVPVTRITTRLRQNDLDMLSFMKTQCRAAAEASGAARIIGDESVYDISSITHMEGSCRMGTDPARSVLNSVCQSHDVRNLFVVDSSAFVTQGGGDSPSLTIHSLALRASNHLIRDTKSGRFS